MASSDLTPENVAQWNDDVRRPVNHLEDLHSTTGKDRVDAVRCTAMPELDEFFVVDEDAELIRFGAVGKGKVC